jgi:hypothetical protein
MTYKEHVDSVIEQLRAFAEDKKIDLILLKNHLQGIVDDIEIEEALLKWECTSCKHVWKASPFLTFIECESCASEDIGHH